MPRLRQTIPRYRKHRASGQAIVTINGRDYYLGPHGTRASKQEYDRVISEWLASGRSPGFGAADSQISVAEMLAAFFAHAKRYYGATSRSHTANLKYAAVPLRELYSRTLAVEFGPAQYKSVRQRMVDKGHCRSHVNRSMKRMVHIFRWAAAEGMIPAEIPQTLAIIPALRKGKTEARESKPIEAVDDATVDATVAHLPPVVADMVRLQRATGMRPAEVCAIRPCDVDRSGDVWRFTPSSHKMAHLDKQRVVFIGPRGQSVLLRYLARDSKAFCFRPMDSESKRRAAAHAARKTPLSCGNRPGSKRTRNPKRPPGEKYTAASYLKAIHRACDKAFPWPELGGRQIESLSDAERAEFDRWRSEHRWSPNRLRHAAATEVRQKYGLEAAQVVLGHSQANVTQVYAERDYTLAARVAREVG